MTTLEHGASCTSASASRASAGKGRSVARALIRLQRSGVSGGGVRGLARGEFLRRKIVDRDGGGGGVRRGAKGLRLGGGDQALRQRGIDVAHVRVAQAVAQRRRVDDEIEGALEPRERLLAAPVEDVDREALARRRRRRQNFP